MLNPLGQALLSMLQSSSTEGQPLWLKYLIGIAEISSNGKNTFQKLNANFDWIFFPIKKLFNIPGSA